MTMHNIKWSNSEKMLARQVFERALQTELAATIEEFKARAARVNNPDELWAIGTYLDRRQRDIDNKYDFRYSQLIHVFGRLLREGAITAEELEGLSEEKLAYIHRIADL